jgi:hypothetical protein
MPYFVTFTTIYVYIPLKYNKGTENKYSSYTVGLQYVTGIIFVTNENSVGLFPVTSDVRMNIVQNININYLMSEQVSRHTEHISFAPLLK